MKPIWTVLAALAAGLAACGDSRSAETPAAGAQSPPSAAAAAKTARGTGTVTAVDTAGGTVTISHGPIPEAGWPAMTMAFKAIPPTLLSDVAVGDRVRFDLKLDGGAGEIVALARD